MFKYQIMMASNGLLVVTSRIKNWNYLQRVQVKLWSVAWSCPIECLQIYPCPPPPSPPSSSPPINYQGSPPPPTPHHHSTRILFYPTLLSELLPFCGEHCGVVWGEVRVQEGWLAPPHTNTQCILKRNAGDWSCTLCVVDCEQDS